MKNKKPSERIEENSYMRIRHVSSNLSDYSEFSPQLAISEIGKILDEMQEKIDKLSE